MTTTMIDFEQNVRRVVQVLMALDEVKPPDAAKALGISRTSFYERMSGKSHFTVVEVAKLAELFSVQPGIFFADPRELVTQGKGAYVSSRARVAA